MYDYDPFVKGCKYSVNMLMKYYDGSIPAELFTATDRSDVYVYKGGGEAAGEDIIIEPKKRRKRNEIPPIEDLLPITEEIIGDGAYMSGLCLARNWVDRGVVNDLPADALKEVALKVLRLYFTCGKRVSRYLTEDQLGYVEDPPHEKATRGLCWYWKRKRSWL